ncbi:MAG: hypothetical protein BGO45_06325 [Microbacterium sp. 71-36]|nr:MAG: hypothetical protein ABS60_09465 [Microbacterium sp. SCN 71-17]OJV75296.1 MAG: hypothetical protein BGO45_06325 [Microbacterium sp. 71-36]
MRLDLLIRVEVLDFSAASASKPLAHKARVRYRQQDRGNCQVSPHQVVRACVNEDRLIHHRVTKELPCLLDDIARETCIICR